MIKFKLRDGTPLPIYKTEGAVGMDVQAMSILAAYKGDQPVTQEKLERMNLGFTQRGFIKLRAFERVLFGTGIIVADMSFDTELQVRSRSGLTLKQGLIVLNAPGTIDPDYRGEIGIILYNTTPYLSTIQRGERIGQLVPKFLSRPFVQEVKEITPSTRGDEGFGSTGKT